MHGQLKEALPPPAAGASEGARLITEELALQQGVRQRGAVDGDEGCLAAGGGVVNRLGQQFFAGAAFAVNHHGVVNGGNLPGGIDKLRHLRRFAEDVFECVFCPEAGLFGAEVLGPDLGVILEDEVIACHIVHQADGIFFIAIGLALDHYRFLGVILRVQRLRRNVISDADLVFVVRPEDFQGQPVGVHRAVGAVCQQHPVFTGVHHAAQHLRFQIAVDIVGLKPLVGLHHRVDVPLKVPVDDADVQIQQLHELEHGVTPYLAVADVDHLHSLPL